jgi:hypothetical protein
MGAGGVEFSWETMADSYAAVGLGLPSSDSELGVGIGHRLNPVAPDPPRVPARPAIPPNARVGARNLSRFAAS